MADDLVSAKVNHVAQVREDTDNCIATVCMHISSGAYMDLLISVSSSLVLLCAKSALNGALSKTTSCITLSHHASLTPSCIIRATNSKASWAGSPRPCVELPLASLDQLLWTPAGVLGAEAVTGRAGYLGVPHCVGGLDHLDVEA